MFRTACIPTAAPPTNGSSRTGIMASPITYRSNSENRSLAKSIPRPDQDISNRRVLGEVTPNAKIHAPIAEQLAKKPLAGSPLKRSFTAALEEEKGWMYLKRRRTSLDRPPVRLDGVSETMREGFERELEEQRKAGHVEVCDVQGSAVSQLSFSIRFRQKSEQKQIPTIHEPSPTEPNTPTSSDLDTQGSSAERASFSSLINYDPSSQNIAASQGSVTVSVKSQAEMLKLRLRVAMYKVRTNQIGVPFSELRVPAEESAEAAVAAAKEKARTDELSAMLPAQQPAYAIPKLLPAPILRPTAYSSRLIIEDYLPSSPPVLTSPERSPERQAHTPLSRRSYQQRLRSPRSPPDSGRVMDDRELTSSVVKGRIAEGLLGLRNAI